MKVAILIDWLVVYAGSERVLEQILQIYPKADLFSLFDLLPEHSRHFLGGRKISTSFLQVLPGLKEYYKATLPLHPLATERFSLAAYDLIISVCHATIRGVLTTREQLHISYLQARPLKYAYEDRLKYPGSSLKHLLEDILLVPIRVWDDVAARRPDKTVAISNYVAQWHAHRHGVEADVINPPTDTSSFRQHFKPLSERKNYYVAVGRLEPYKRFDILIEAFRKLGLPLKVIGSGSEASRLVSIAGGAPNIEFVGSCNSGRVAEVVSSAKAFVFAGCEDFGISTVEALATGTPVIALGKGGSAEICNRKEHGLLFHDQTVDALVDAVHKAEAGDWLVDPKLCILRAEELSAENFKTKFAQYVADCYAEHRRGQ